MEQKINKRERWKSVLLCVCVCERRKERAEEKEATDEWWERRKRQKKRLLLHGGGDESVEGLALVGQLLHLDEESDTVA